MHHYHLVNKNCKKLHNSDDSIYLSISRTHKQTLIRTSRKNNLNSYSCDE